MKEDDAIRKVDCFLNVVSDCDYGGVFPFYDFDHHFLHFPSHLCIEGAEGLIHEENAGILGEGTRNRDSLFHATGEAGRVGVAEALEMYEPQQLL